LSDYVGKYYRAHIKLNKGVLFLDYDLEKNVPLQKIEKDVFTCSEFHRIKFHRNSENQIDWIEIKRWNYLEIYHKQNP